MKLLEISCLISVFYFFSCKEKQNEITCKKNDGNIVECHCEDANYSFFFDNYKLGMILINDEGSYSDIRFFEGTNKMANVIFTSNKYPSIVTNLFFDTDGQLLESKQDYPELFEFITEKRIGDTNYFYVYNKIKNLDIYTVTSYFTLNNFGDTISDYFYYKLTSDKKYSIKTNSKYFELKNENRDSMYIQYVESDFQNVNFDSPIEHNYYPNFKGHTSKKIYNKLDIDVNKSTHITGILWGFYKERTHPFAHRPLILNGDLSSRIENFKETTKRLEKKYAKANIGSNLSLKIKLNNLGIEIKENDLILSKELKNAIKNAK